MKTFFTTLSLLSFVFMFEMKAQISISDCPASPYAIEVTQPDNTKISIMGKGSMLNSWTETLDGYSIVKNKLGVYEYAQNNNGQLVSSGFLVVENGQNPDKQNFLNEQGKHLRPTIVSEELSNASITGTSVDNAPDIDLAFPTQGTHKVLVLLIDYPDLTDTHTVSEFENFMNQEGYNSTGSFRDYFLKISDNKLDVNADVVGWYTAANSYEYYGKKNGYERAQELVREAVDAAETAGVDFSIYDNDKDGYVDGVIVVHAGQGAEEGSDEDYIWSHRWALNSSAVQYDGVTINDYMINPERRIWANNGSGGIVGIGVFCHEFGHGLGLPDLYDTDYTSAGIGSWGLMSGGGWLGDEEVPCFMSAWSRASLDWVTPEKISSGAYSLASSTTSTQVYKINTSVPKEYFLLENRQQSGQDAYLKGSGLAIWHIDDNQRVTDNTDNTDENHRLIDLEQADGLGQLYTEDGSADDGDLYPGSTSNTMFTGTSTPNSNTYDLAASGIQITEITDASGVVNFNVSGGDESYDPVNVIFSLDLTNYPGAQTPPYIYGEWDGYCRNCNVMTDADDDGIWTDTISMGRGDYTFVFMTGVAFQSGTRFEGFNDVSTSCNVLVPRGTAFDGDYYMRTLTVTGQTASQLYGEGTVMWNSCPPLSMIITAASSTGDVADGALSNDASLVLTFISSLETTNFTAEDITAIGGLISNFASTSASVYTATFTPSADGAISIDVVAGAFTDAAGDNNLATSQFNWTYDGTQPTVEITAANSMGTVENGASSNEATLTLTFTSSEGTEDFTSEDITATGGLISNFTSTSASVYTATFTPSADGATTIDISAGAFIDVAGNSNTAASQFNWTYDGTQPTLEITAANSVGTVENGAASNDATLTLTFTSSEATTDFLADDVTVTGGTMSDFSATSRLVYTAIFTPLVDGATTIDISAGAFIDVAGNSNTAASQFNWTYDGTLPTMEITAANTEGVVTEGTTSDDATLILTFTSSEGTVDFTADDITATGGTISSFSATNTSVYTAVLTPSANGAVTIGVLANAFTDAAGNNNTAAVQFNWTFEEEEILNIGSTGQLIPFTFYPNPVKGTLYIKSSNAKEINVFEMFNLSGKKVLDFHSDTQQVDLTGLSEGIYLIRSKNNLMSSQRIIISK